MRSFSLSLLLLLLLSGAACSGEDGTTPTCTQNAGPDGVTADPAEGCHQFATCNQPDIGDAGPASGCCVGDAGKVPVLAESGRDGYCSYVSCRYGYGAELSQSDRNECFSDDSQDKSN